MVYDFLSNTRKTENEICVILDLPGADRETVAAFFCDRICNGEFRDLKFSFDGVEKTVRVILKGIPEQVLGLVDACSRQQGL